MEGEKKVTRRIGSFTFGIMMILMGINIFLQTITSADFFRFTLSLWPIVFVSLGIETLYFTNKKNVEIKYDILGVFTIFIVLFLGIIFSTVNYGINKVLYNKEVKEDIISYLVDTDYNMNFSDRVSINNISQGNVVVKFVENKSADDVLVKVNFEYNDSYKGSVLQVLRQRDIMHTALNFDYEDQKITVENMPAFVKNIEIVVTANDISKLNYDGEIIH
jgi:hypothetical protein